MQIERLPEHGSTDLPVRHMSVWSGIRAALGTPGAAPEGPGPGDLDADEGREIIEGIYRQLATIEDPRRREEYTDTFQEIALNYLSGGQASFALLAYIHAHIGYLYGVSFLVRQYKLCRNRVRTNRVIDVAVHDPLPDVLDATPEIDAAVEEAIRSIKMLPRDLATLVAVAEANGNVVTASVKLDIKESTLRSRLAVAYKRLSKALEQYGFFFSVEVLVGVMNRIRQREQRARARRREKRRRWRSRSGIKVEGEAHHTPELTYPECPASPKTENQNCEPASPVPLL